MQRSWIIGCLSTLILLSAGTIPARAAGDFQIWLNEFKAEAIQKGIRPETVDTALAGVQPIDRVLELDRKQPEFSMTFDSYIARVVSPQRIARGRALLAEERPLLDAVAERYGVPAPVIVAMWGIESDFGRITGNFETVHALATLAYDGRRGRYFRGELMNALTMIDRNNLSVVEMTGSWAGAMGQCQFMPSTYLSYAVDWDGDGKADIWTNRADVFASAANYLSRAGWDPAQGWGRRVLPPEHGIAEILIGADQKRAQTEWARLGLRNADGTPLAPGEGDAFLIRAETGKGNDRGAGPLYLVGNNFQVFMRWNKSTFFALAAGSLADAIGTH